MEFWRIDLIAFARSLRIAWYDRNLYRKYCENSNHWEMDYKRKQVGSPTKARAGFFLIFENWVAPKLGGRSGIYKMGDSDILWSG